MMHTNPFESYDELIKSGAHEQLARTIVKAVEAARSDSLENIATKQDILNTELKIELRIADVKSELGKEISQTNIHLTKLTENINMIKWLCIGIFIPIIAASIKVFFSTIFGQ